MAKVFITGIAGFLGSWIADEMLKLGHTVRGIDNLIGGDPNNVPVSAICNEVDCNDIDLVSYFMRGADIVYHCAATAYEGLSVFSPHLVTQNIVTASTGVFSAAIQNKVKRIVHCSSMARYGSIGTPYTEEMVCRPQDPYGIGKLCVEEILRNLCKVHEIEYVIAVPHNIIGPRQKYDDPFRNVAAIMINRALQGKSIIVYGDGTQRRCFSFIDDCLQCLVKMAFQNNVVGEVINIGPDEEPVSINQLVQIVKEMTGEMRAEITHMLGRPQEVHTAICSSDKARRLLDYKTQTSLRDGIGHMVDFIRERGIKPFEYHLPLEIVSEKTPKTWTEQLF